MRAIPKIPQTKALRVLASVVAATTLSSYVATATPYASSLTNNGGTISFRLNENATKVTISWNNGATNLNLGAKNRGLTVTNIGATSPFYVQVVGAGNNTIATNNQMAFNSLRGVAVNFNPASPYFGRVYVGNTAAGMTNGVARSLGVYAHTADFNDVFGAARTPPGVTFGSNGAGIQRLNVGEDDDLLYMADWTDASGNLSYADQNFTTGGYALAKLTGTAATPVGINNNHGSVAAVWVYGSQAKGNLTILTVDEDLQDNRTATGLAQINSVWRYDVGSTAFPYTGFVGDSNPLTNRIVSPAINYASNVESLSRGTNGYLYFCQGRANGAEPGVYVVTNYGPGQTYQYGWNNPNVWNSLTASRALGSSTDYLLGCYDVTVSRDGRWLATFNFNNNATTVVRLTNGIPDLSKRVTFNHPSGTTAPARSIAFDAANNLILACQGYGYVYQISLGLSATNTTGSDGTFVSAQPPLVEVITTNNLAHRGLTPVVPGTFTFTRAGDLSQPLTVNFTVSGSAVSGTDYTPLGTSVTIPAGADHVDLPVVPINGVAKTPTAVTVTLATGANYNLLTARSATLAIVDHSTPSISLTRNFTNMYERLDRDFIRLTLTRVGETNTAFLINLTNAGTAVYGVDYLGPNNISGSPPYIPAGASTLAVEYNPLRNYVADGNKTLVVGVGPDLWMGETPNYTNNGSAVGTFTLIDSDLPTEDVLWSDDFDAYYGQYGPNSLPPGWTATYAALTNTPQNDYNFTFGYNYAMDNIPSAPGTYSSFGLKATVNKDTTPAAAALNFYPNQTFSGNYALRFSMMLILGNIANTEHATFGINHSGTMTNWNRNGGLPSLQATNQDGLWFSVSASANSGWDFCGWTKPATTTATSAGILTNRTGNPAAGMDQVFKNDNLASLNTTGLTPLQTGPYAMNGAPGCSYDQSGGVAKNWVDVEVAQVGNMVVLRLNNQTILATTNLTPYTSGKVMLGYNDMFDSIGDPVNANVYYDNVRVVRISAPTIATQPTSVVVAAGKPASLSVAASTTTGITNYQWYLNGTAIANATNATHSIASVVLANYGNYWVVVDDGTYPVTSATATLTPPAPSIISVLPASRAGVIGSPASFTVVAATSTGVTNYQWKLYGTNLTSGATSATYSIASATAASFGPYTVTVSDGFSAALTSPTANLTQALVPTASQSVSGSTLNLKFNTEVGPNYYVEYKTNLTDAAWLPLSTNSGTGGQLTIPDNLNTAPTRFYRIRVQ